MINLDNVCILTIDGRHDNKDLYLKYNKIFNFCNKEIKFKYSLHLTSFIEDEYLAVEQPNCLINAVKIPNLNYAQYNIFCVNYLYHYIKNIDCDYYMFIHDDGFIINPNLWSDDFLKYDYIGAPWINNEDEPEFGWVTTYGKKAAVGNGGFCIRSKKFLYESSKLPYTFNANEDVYLCAIMNEHLINLGIKFADIETAAKFSLETKTRKYNTLKNTFGFHGKHNLEEVKNIITNCELFI